MSDPLRTQVEEFAANITSTVQAVLGDRQVDLTATVLDERFTVTTTNASGIELRVNGEIVLQLRVHFETEACSPRSSAIAHRQARTVSRSRASDRLVLLREDPHRARRLGAHPPSLTPHQRRRLPERRGVDQPHLTPTVATSDDTTGRAAHGFQAGLHRDGQPATIVTVHADHVQPVQANEKVTTVAVAPRARQHDVGSAIVEVLEVG